MSDAPGRPPSDDAIRAMLAARADRLRPQPLDETGAFADALRGSRQERRTWRLWPALTATASLSALVAVALVAVVLPSRAPTASNPPSAGPSMVSPASAAPFATPAVLSPGQLLQAVSSSADGLVGRLVPVRGSLVSVHPSCALGASACPGLITLISDASGSLRIRKTGTVESRPDAAGNPADAIWIVRVTDEHVADQPVVELIGGLKQGPDGALTFTVRQLLANLDETRVGSLVAVDGWLVRTPLHSCPSVLSSSVRYDCPNDVYLTDAEFQPLLPGGSSIGPPAGISLPSDSYEQWAPDPAAFQTGGVVPRRAVYLLRSASVTCSSGTACESFRQAEVVGRLDPLTAAVPSPEPSDAQSVAEVLAASASDPFAFADGRQLVVHGWLVRTPPLRCKSVFIGPYDCSELDFLTDEPFQPWSADGVTGSARSPDAGMRVQNGAYDAFAPDPQLGSDGAYPPREGTYVVRGVIRSGCETMPQPEGSVAPCAGPAVLFWEIVERR